MRVTLTILGGFIGFLLGGGFHAIGSGHFYGLVFGAFVGFVDGWIIDLERRQKGVQYGQPLGWFNGALIGALVTSAGGGGFLHGLFAIIAYGWIGSMVADQVVPGLLKFWDALDQ